GVDLERLGRVEQQLALLWEKVQQRDQKQDQRHSDILGLYGSLREQLQSQNERESFEVWVSSLMEQRLGVLRGELEQESTNRAQVGLDDHYHLILTVRWANLPEVGKITLCITCSFYPFISVGVKQEDHDALLLEVQRLEAELSKIRISSQVSSQLRKELQVLFFGSGASAEQGEIPQSLIHWLSQRYVSTPDLQAALASIELSILKNISLQLEHSQAQTLDEAESRTRSIVQTVKGAVQHTSSTEGLSEENALKLYSQDRTGQVDYALESGGGSILSTRCSETYETKTALMSLFGLPLWYFSQSPRVVIQGLDDEYQEEGTLLGHYTYEDDGESLQFFSVKIIEVRVLSNWGHPEYTCLYRFRVHGEPRPE
ncbi:hypothetical protein GOODEAATRI_004100, partial [Goodea atripinnis]